MRNYRAIIVDDHQGSIDHLMDHIEKIEQVEVAAHFTDPFSALTYVRINPVDLVILDVEFGHRINGFDWISTVPKLQLKFILYTGFKHFEDQGYLMNVVDVLHKPVSYLRFVTAIHRLDAEIRLQLPDNHNVDSLEHSSDYLQICHDAKWDLQLVWFKEVVYFKTHNGYVLIHMATGDKVLLSRSPFRRIRELLPRKWFKQCARGIIFNINFFQSYGNKKMRLNQVRDDIPTGDVKKYPDFREFLEYNSI